MEQYENDEKKSSESPNYNSDIDFTLKKYQMEIQKNNKKSIFVNTDSSSDSVKINLDNIDFVSMKDTNKTTLYYNMDQLSTLTFPSIYNILLTVSYLIFVDNKKLIKKTKNSCFKQSINLIDTEFPGCTFFPFELVDTIKKNIHMLNNKILNAESRNQYIYTDDEICYGISFDDNNIIKNCLYKRMEIIDMIMFIPIEKYNIKQTEYKIRGFCQIVEELGAKSIDITFKKNNNTHNNKIIETKLGSDIEIIASNLGLSSSSTNIITDDENYHYTLTYPANNTIILNEHIIRSKIKKKKFIISEPIYNSNLELQYLVHSRCKHQINKYSTVFTFDNNNVIEQSIFTNLKIHGIELGVRYKDYSMNKNSMSIVTNVVFSSSDDFKDIINGNNVSLDNIGFTFLIECIKKTGNFKINGIYKIMVFINEYIEKVFINTHFSLYKTVNTINRKIKKILTLTEYAELLCNHFSDTSQWVHLTNYIDMLSNKTQSYDKLGYIIIVCNNNISYNDRVDILLRFIQQKCIEKKIEDKYWQMLQPFNIRLKNELKNKLLYEYNFIQNYNWYNLNILIQSIEKYTINFINMKKDEHFACLIQNMIVGYKNWEFNNNIIPFIIRHAHTIHYEEKDELYLCSIFEKSLNINSFTISKINNIDDLTQYINKKINRIKKIYEWINNNTYPITIEKFHEMINSKDFIDKHDYINKKLYTILGNKTIKKIKDWLEYDILAKIVNTIDTYIGNEKKNKVSFSTETDEVNETNITIDLMYKIINKLICYNDKLNINEVPSNYLGYTIVYNNYINGIRKTEFKKIIIPFIINHITDKGLLKIILNEMTLSNFNTNCSSYYDMFIYLKSIMEKNNMDTANIVSDFVI